MRYARYVESTPSLARNTSSSVEATPSKSASANEAAVSVASPAAMNRKVSIIGKFSSVTNDRRYSAF